MASGRRRGPIGARWVAGCAIALLLGSGYPGRVDAQGPPRAGWGVLVGVVRDADERGGIAGAEVTLPDLGRRTFSSDTGWFRLPLLAPGVYRLQVSRLGYAVAVATVEVVGGEVVECEVLMRVEPVPLEGVTVTARRELPGTILSGLRDFQRRRDSGWGQFLLEDEIRLRGGRTTDLLHGVMGVDVFANGAAIFIRRTQCPPTVYLDDVKVTHCSVGGGPSSRGRDCNPAREAAEAVNLLTPSEILAIEVYRGPAETPGQYIDSNSRCGVILIWSRRGLSLGPT